MMAFINPAIPVVGKSIFDVPVVVKEVKLFCPYCHLDFNDWKWAESSFDGDEFFVREECECPVCGRKSSRIVIKEEVI